jgi:hypothetical protein
MGECDVEMDHYDDMLGTNFQFDRIIHNCTHPSEDITVSLDVVLGFYCKFKRLALKLGSYLRKRHGDIDFQLH